jgi:tRNA threonylcarbamoyladenosine biosynthesis protein TsaE
MPGRKIRISSRSAEETLELGREIGSLFKAGAVLALTGELGSGKTVFIQGLAQGLDIPDEYYITSPTYTIVNEYPGRLTLFHLDLYRISDHYEYEEIGLYEMLESDGVVAIEWANMLPDNILDSYIAIDIQISGKESRGILVSTCGQYEGELMEQVGKRMGG